MATFDSKTIVMMAENGHSVEIDGKKIQMTIVQEAVEANPNDVPVLDVPSEIKIVVGAYGLGLCFSENQTLFYDVNSHCYAVLLKHGYSLLTCIATECKFEDLKEGDLFFATDQKTPDFTCLFEYNFLNKNNKLIWTDGSNIAVANKSYTHYLKITPKP